MGAHYDYVIVDSAPVLPVSDSVALAGAVDGLFIVAQAGRVTEPQVVETVECLGRVSAPILGLVLNKAFGKRSDVYSYGGYAALPTMPATAKLPDPVAGTALDA
jgi:Mrp family chromosome partitioning ATPase